MKISVPMKQKMTEWVKKADWVQNLFVDETISATVFNQLFGNLKDELRAFKDVGIVSKDASIEEIRKQLEPFLILEQHSSSILSHDDLQEKLQRVEAHYNSPQAFASLEPSYLQKALGVLTFANFIWTIAIIMIVIGFHSLVGVYLIALLAKMSHFTLQILAWALVFCLICGGIYKQDTPGMFISLAGCLGMIFCSLYTIDQLKTEHAGSKDYFDNAYQIMNIGLTLVWGIVAMMHSSQIIGAFTVMVLMNAIGFSAAMTPLCYIVGFETSSALIRAFLSSGFLLSLHSFLVIRNINLGPFQCFERGLLVCASLVFYFATVIGSSKWFGREHAQETYLLRNIIAFISLFGFGYIGNVFPQLGTLQKMSGTFTILFLLEKYVELASHFEGKEAFALATLGFGGTLYVIARLVHAFPEMFIFL